MKAIYKYPLELKAGPQTVQMPINGKIKSVFFQNGSPTLWAEIDTAEKKEIIRHFFIVPTGEPISDILKYIGTVFQDDGLFVWHIYEHAM